MQGRLILERRPGEKIKIGDDITIEVGPIDRNQCKIIITAPRNISILRSELLPHNKERSDESKSQ